MAEKLTLLTLDALTRAASQPAGMPLFSSRTDQGLFPRTTIARAAATQALADGLLQIIRTETRGRQSRELTVATEAGLKFLLEKQSPQKIVEELVRVLDRQEQEVDQLIGSVNRIAERLDALKTIVTAAFPSIVSKRVLTTSHETLNGPGIPANQSRQTTSCFTNIGESNRLGVSSMNGVATLDLPTALDTSDDLAMIILAQLADWIATAAAGQDCPLPELYRSLATREVTTSIGAFHDCLRELVIEQRIYLHPWTGPLYAIPEPAYALLVGHNVAYYASTRGSH